MRDRTHPLELLRQAAARRNQAGVRRGLVSRRPDDDGLVDLASNDYLGLCGDPRLAAGAARVAQEWGTGATGSRLVTGTTALHTRLEARLAEFAGAQAALVFSSGGYLANLTVLSALAAALGGPDEVLIVSEAGNHASLIDGCRLARARVTVTPHRDPDAVRKVLADRDEPAAIMVSDAVFSVDGAQAPVAELHAAAREHGALLVLDEAHAFGVTGPGGRGAAAGAGIAAEPDLIRTITLSKALAGQGGAVLAAPEVIGTLVDTGRGFIFDTGLAPPSVGAALAALEVVAAEPELGARQGRGGPAGHDRGRGGLAGQRARRRRARSDGGRVCCRRSFPKGLCRLRCARRLLPAALGPRGQACLRLTGRASLTEADFAAAARALAAVRGGAELQLAAAPRHSPFMLSTI